MILLGDLVAVDDVQLVESLALELGSYGCGAEVITAVASFGCKVVAHLPELRVGEGVEVYVLEAGVVGRRVEVEVGSDVVLDNVNLEVGLVVLAVEVSFGVQSRENEPWR
jgi:hypothetical protein